ncbi:MAG: PhzF family phenazine biosynthesis protein [Gemmatimonadota bacterium]
MSPTPLPFAQADAFTDTPFAGNPAAVCLLEHALDAQLMQNVAIEMNLSETAFVEPPDAEGLRRLRWFTPGLEVDLCGHATLATAHLLFERGTRGPLRFSTRSGELVVEQEPDGRLRMDFPAVPVEDAPVPPGLLEALGIGSALEAARGPAGQYWMVVVDRADTVRALTPDYGTLGRVDLDGRIGVSVTAAGNDVDFVSRFFAPWAGIDEDPVTGSAHCMLAPWWSDRLGRATLQARQISARGGDVETRVVGDRVHLVGRAVTVAEGTLLLP